MLKRQKFSAPKHMRRTKNYKVYFNILWTLNTILSRTFPWIGQCPPHTYTDTHTDTHAYRHTQIPTRTYNGLHAFKFIHIPVSCLHFVHFLAISNENVNKQLFVVQQKPVTVVKFFYRLFFCSFSEWRVPRIKWLMHHLYTAVIYFILQMHTK